MAPTTQKEDGTQYNWLHRKCVVPVTRMVIFELRNKKSSNNAYCPIYCERRAVTIRGPTNYLENKAKEYLVAQIPVPRG